MFIPGTNAIESVNSRIRRAVRARGHFPTEEAALNASTWSVMALDPTGRGQKRWITRWKPASNAFDITFDRRLVSQAIVVATGVRSDGWREVLGFAVGDSVDGAFWTAFLRRATPRWSPRRSAPTSPKPTRSMRASSST